MRKTILMLINGFGIERNGSMEIYSSKLMPNLDKMTKECLFGTLTSNAGDYNNGYKIFSIPSENKSKDDEIDNLIYEKKLNQNEVFIKLQSTLTIDNKLHIFYTLENDEKWMQVKEMLKLLNPDKNKKIFFHLILEGTSTSQYKSIEKIIGKLLHEIGSYCDIGFIVGKNNINSDDVLRAFYRELGEHWNEYEKKINIFRNDVINPEDATVFIINEGFALKEGDSVLFLNYDNIDMNKFFNDFTKMPSLNLFSLYQFKNNVLNMFEKKEESNTSIVGLLEKNNINLMVFTTQDRINDLNFYLHGMEKKKSSNVTYAINDKSLFSTKEKVINVIESQNRDGFILDYNIGLMNKGDDIKQELSYIDNIIGNIKDASKEKDYTFIISSLYGMHAQVMDGVLQKVVDFSGKVPCVFQSNTFVKGEYSLNSGDTYSLGLTFLTNINDEVKGNKLVHKMSGLEKVLSKK